MTARGHMRQTLLINPISLLSHLHQLSLLIRINSLLAGGGMLPALYALADDTSRRIHTHTHIPDQEITKKTRNMTLGVSTIIYICRYTFLFFFGVFVMFDSMCLRGREVFCYFFWMSKKMVSLEVVHGM